MNAWFVRFTSAVLLLTLCGLLVLFHIVFLQRISPLVSQRLVSIEATTAGGHGVFVIAHEFCLEWASEASALRIFRRMPRSPDALEEVYELPPVPVHLNEGCHVRPRAVAVPDMVEAGQYIYHSGLRFCNEVRCKTEWLPPVLVHVDSFDARHPLRFEPIKPPKSANRPEKAP